MESISDISAWLTPAIIVGLFLWLRADSRSTREELRADIRSTREELRADIRSTREELRADIHALQGRIEKRFDGIDRRFDGVDKRFDGVDERLRAVEAGQAEIKGQLSFVRDYVLHRNLRETEDATEAAPGD